MSLLRYDSSNRFISQRLISGVSFKSLSFIVFKKRRGGGGHFTSQVQVFQVHVSGEYCFRQCYMYCRLEDELSLRMGRASTVFGNLSGGHANTDEPEVAQAC